MARVGPFQSGGRSQGQNHASRAGEAMIDRATRLGRGQPHARLTRGRLASQASNARRNSTSRPRLLDLVVDGSEDFFRRLAPENWGGRMMPLSVRIPVLAGVATVLNAPEFWAETFAGVMMPSLRAAMLRCIRSLASAAPRAASVEPPKF